MVETEEGHSSEALMESPSLGHKPTTPNSTLLDFLRQCGASGGGVCKPNPEKRAMVTEIDTALKDPKK